MEMIISLGISDSRHGMKLKLPKRASLTKSDRQRCHHLGHVTIAHFTDQKINLKFVITKK